LVAGHDPAIVQDLALHKRPGLGQSLFCVHGVMPFWHVLALHKPPVMGQSPADEHDVEPLLHSPLTPGQVAAELHTAWGGLLQFPGQSIFKRQAAPPFLQLPAAGQSVDREHAWLVLLQWPPMIAQSLATAQTVLLMLHWPTGRHAPCDMQEAPLMLHAPASVGQSVLAVAAVQLA
jgi:hypothetical protein